MEKFLNDNVVIPDEIMKMSKEERKSEIARLEAEAASVKAAILSSSSKHTA